jgi:hypothetical protein
VINVPHKKYEGEIVGKHGTVLSVTHNGWVKVQVRHADGASQVNKAMPQIMQHKQTSGSRTCSTDLEVLLVSASCG